MNTDQIYWSDLAELNHASQVERFGFCTCEEQEYFPYDDCPNKVAHHFIVKYVKGEGWSWDIETESAQFSEGTIYINGEGWKRSGNLFDSPIYDADEEASSALCQALRIMNQVAPE